MDNQSYEVWLQDEIPKFHSGKRIVTVVKTGDKWVWVTCGSKKAKIRKSLWMDILTKSIKAGRRMNPHTRQA